MHNFKLHDKLNSDKMLVMPPLKPQGLTGNVPKNWLLALLEEAVWAVNIHKHLGPLSSYPLKEKLEESLKIIYQYLQDPSLSAGMKTSIREKLREGVENCPRGFHNRVCEILRGFEQPQTVEDILHNIRFNIVEREAQRHGGGEVHTNNRFFVIARELGFNIHPLNSSDLTRGVIDDEEITLYLWKAFKENYHPNAIIAAFEEQLQSIFAHAGVAECGEKCYPYETYNVWLDFLNNLLQGENSFTCLKLDEETSAVIGLNWNEINKTVWYFLSSRGYFNFSIDEHLFFIEWYFSDNPKTALLPEELKLLTEHYPQINKEIYTDPLLFLHLISHEDFNKLGVLWNEVDKKEAEDTLSQFLIEGDKNLLARIKKLAKNSKIDRFLQGALISAWQESIATHRIAVLNQLVSSCSAMQVDLKAISGEKLDFLLIPAIEENCSCLLQGVLLAGANANGTAADNASMPPLILAAKKASSAMVRMLVENGANVEVRDRDNQTALILAVRAGNLKMVNFLLANNANVNALDAKDFSPLCFAAIWGNTSLVNTLINHGAKVSHETKIQTTPLFYAAIGGHFQVVETLLKNGASVNVTWQMKTTPLLAAAQRGHFNVVEILLSPGFEEDYVLQPMDNAVLVLAAEKGELQIVNRLIDKGADINLRNPHCMTPLILVAGRGNLELVERLIGKGANVNENVDGNTALIAAVQNGHYQIIAALLAAGADPNQRSQLYVNALILAVEKKFVDIVALLLQNRANPNEHSPTHRPALLTAVAYGNPELVKLLLEYGADVNVTDWKGCTALMLAAKSKKVDVFINLLEKGANIEARDLRGTVFDYIRRGVSPQLASQAERLYNLHGETLQLLRAAEKGDLLAVESSLSKGAIIQAVNKDQLSALKLALVNNHPEVIMKLWKIYPCKKDCLQALPSMSSQSIDELLNLTKEDSELRKMLLLQKISLRIARYQASHFAAPNSQRVVLLAKIPEILAQVSSKPLEEIIRKLHQLGEEAQEHYRANSLRWFFSLGSSGFKQMIEEIKPLVKQLDENAFLNPTPNLSPQAGANSPP